MSNKISRGVSLLLVLLLTCAAASCARTVETTSEYWEYESGSKTSKSSESEDGQEESADSKAESTATSSKKVSAAQSVPDKISADGAINLKGKKIRIASWSEGAGPRPSSRTYQKETELVAEIEQKYNCKLEWVTEFDPVLHTNKFTTAAMAGSIYGEIVNLPGDAAYPLHIIKGYFNALDDYIDVKDVHWHKATRENLAMDGKHYLFVPAITVNSTAGSGIYFNKSLFAKFSQKTPYEYMQSNSWNWKTFKTLAEALTKKEGNTEYYALANISPVTFIQSNGIIPIKIVDGKGTFNLDNQKTYDAVQFVYDLFHSGYIPAADGMDRWKNGTVAMVVDSWYNGKKHLEALGGNNVGYVHTPIGDAVKDYYYPNVGNMYVYGIPSVIKDVELIKALSGILKDFTMNYKWRESAEQKLEPFMGDKTALKNAVDQVNWANREIHWVSVYPYFTWKVLWTEFGIREKTSPQSFIASVKQASIDDINAMWKK